MQMRLSTRIARRFYHVMSDAVQSTKCSITSAAVMIVDSSLATLYNRWLMQNEAAGMPMDWPTSMRLAVVI
jgi:hypothetical protein